MLVKWYCNVLTLLSERELAPPVALATNEQKQAIVRLLNHLGVSRPRKSKELVWLASLIEAQAAALITELTTLTTTPPTRPAGAGVTMNRRGQLAVAAWTRYARDPKKNEWRAAQPGEPVGFTVANN